MAETDLTAQVTGSLAKMWRLLTILALVVIGVVGYFVITAVINFFKADTSVDETVVSRLVGLEPNDSVVTSLATIDLMWLQTQLRNDRGRCGNQWGWFTLTQLADQATRSNTCFEIKRGKFEKSKVSAYCWHTYDITFGYPSRSDMLSAGSTDLAKPDIIGVHPTFSQGDPTKHIQACMAFNRHREPLLLRIRETLAEDGVLSLHEKQGQLAAAQLLDLENPACMAGAPTAQIGEPCRVPALYTQWEEQRAATRSALTTLTDLQEDLASPDPDAAFVEPMFVLFNRAFAALGLEAAEATSESDEEELFESLSNSIVSFAAEAMNFDLLDLGSAASVGAIQATISTLYASSASWDPWWWFEKNGIYIQRDTTRIVYGSSSAVTGITRLGTTTLVEHAKPRALFVDRRTTFNARSGDDAPWERVEPPGDEGQGTWISNVTAKIEASVATMRERVDPAAIAAAELTIRRQLQARLGPKQLVIVSFRGDSE